jgi:uncharacterized membrane protein
MAHYLKTSLWVVPLLCMVGGAATSFICTTLDDGTLVPQSVSGHPSAAMQILYLIAFSMLTLTGLVLSLLVVAVQLAMGTFSPRIVRQILQDRPSQLAIGLFVGTFTHALLSMRKVESLAEGGRVPGLAVIVAIGLVLSCIATVVWYLNHITQSLRTAALVGWVARDTMTTLDHVYADPGAPVETRDDLLMSRHAGVLFEVGYSRLVEQARAADCRLELLWAVGDFVPRGAPLVRVVGDPTGLSPKRVVAAIALGPERTLNQDVAYGMRMLVDIAERSLASGPFADPTTAVQAVDRLHDLLRQLVRRPLHTGLHHDRQGVLRVTAPTATWDAFVHIATDEIIRVGSPSPQVSRRLVAALEDLLAMAPEDRRPVLRSQLELLSALADEATPGAVDAATATTPDPSGIGSAEGLLSPASSPDTVTQAGEDESVDPQRTAISRSR